MNLLLHSLQIQEQTLASNTVVVAQVCNLKVDINLNLHNFTPSVFEPGKCPSIYFCYKEGLFANCEENDKQSGGPWKQPFESRAVCKKWFTCPPVRTDKEQ